MADVLDLQELREMIDERRVWTNQLEPLRVLWGLAWQRWRIVPLREHEKRTDKHRSQTHVPYAFHHVETAVPRIVGADPRMTYRALDLPGDTPVAHIQTGVACWQMERMGFKLQLKRFGRQGLITGYSVAKTGWVRTVVDKAYTERVPKWDQHLKDIFTVEEQRQMKVMTKNSPFFDPVNNIDFVFPIECRDLDECPAVWQRRRVKLGYLRRMQEAGIYKNTDQVKGTSTRTSVEQTWWQAQRDQQGITLGNLGYNSDDPRSDVELWERWQDDRLTVIAEGEGEPVCLRDDPNPFWHGQKPFVDYSPFPEMLQMPGQGLAAILEDLNNSLDTSRRQREDALAVTVLPAFKGRGIDSDQLELYPGGYNEVDDLNDLVPLYLPAIDYPSSERFEERLILDMQDMSGMSAALSGSTRDAGAIASTATGVQSVTSESNKRAEEMIDELAQRTMKRWGTQLASMNAQFLEGEVAADFSKEPGALEAWLQFQHTQEPPPGVMSRVGHWLHGTPPVGPMERPANGIIVVDADWLKAKGRLEPLPRVGQDEEQSKLQKRSDATQYINALTPFLAMVPCPVNVKAVIEYVSDQYDISKEVADQILNNQAEVAAAAAQAMAAQQQAPPTSGPSGPGGDNLSTGLASGSPGVSGG